MIYPDPLYRYESIFEQSTATPGLMRTTQQPLKQIYKSRDVVLNDTCSVLDSVSMRVRYCFLCPCEVDWDIQVSRKRQQS